MGLSDNGIDKLGLVSHTLQEQITAGRITVTLHVKLRQVRLKVVRQAAQYNIEETFHT
jgi:hypothetical protein